MSELPIGWAVGALDELTEIAPAISVDGMNDDDLVHFVPMSAAAENFAGVCVDQLRPLHEVRKGYTGFIEGDVLLAKITPCMENGKGGLVPALPKKVAFGSTEFHVLRPCGAVSGIWLAHFLSQPEFRKSARANMTGTAGQMRVPTKWLREVDLPLPPRPEQTRIVAKLEELLSDLDAGVAELKAAQKKLAQYRQSLLKAAVEGALTAEWREQQRAMQRSAPLSPRGRGAGGEGAVTSDQDTWLRDRARELRKTQTPAEHVLWQQLRAKRFSGFKFRRQQAIGQYIVDFVCFGQKLIVELDGSQHADATAYDVRRDAWLQQQGFRVLRFWNNEWEAQPESVLEAIWSALQETPPLPNPSPTRGEGLESETGAQLLQRILTERRARWEAKQLTKFAEQGKTPPKDWQKKYPEPVQPDTIDLPELPQGWVWASIDQLTVEQKYGSSSKTNEDPTGIPVLRMGNIQDGDLDFSNLKYLPGDHDEFPGLHLQDGDLLFNRTNSPELVGKTAVYRSQISPCSFASYLISVRFSGGYIPELASAFINSAYGKRWIKSVVVQQVGQANVNGSKLSALAVPVPPFKEQQEILSALHVQTSEIVDQLKIVDVSLKQSNAQRQNILRAAFSGQLVPQDPNDEPASVLLERIRAERAAQAATKKPRGRKTKELR